MTHIDELELVFQIKGATVASDIPSPQYQRMYERMFGFISQGDEDKALKSTALHQLIFDLSNALLAVQEVLAVDDEVTTNLVAENSRCSIELREGRVMFSLMAHVIINLNSAMTMPDFISWCTRHQGDLLKCFAMVAGNVQGGQFDLAPEKRTPC